MPSCERRGPTGQKSLLLDVLLRTVGFVQNACEERLAHVNVRNLAERRQGERDYVLVRIVEIDHDSVGRQQQHVALLIEEQTQSEVSYLLQ